MSGLPVLLIVVAGTIRRLGCLAGVATLLIHGEGMAVLLLLVTLALAFGKQALFARLWPRNGNGPSGRGAGRGWCSGSRTCRPERSTWSGTQPRSSRSSPRWCRPRP